MRKIRITRRPVRITLTLSCCGHRTKRTVRRGSSGVWKCPRCQKAHRYRC